MRRKDREITDNKSINEIIRNCSCCRLAFTEENGPYIVPLNFGLVADGDERTLYFHGATSGHKIDLADKCDSAGFEMDCSHDLISNDKPCDFTYHYQSVIGKGKVSLLTDRAEKAAALNAIMSHYSDRDNWDFEDKIVDNTAVIKLVVTEISCKANV